MRSSHPGEQSVTTESPGQLLVNIRPAIRFLHEIVPVIIAALQRAPGPAEPASDDALPASLVRRLRILVQGDGKTFLRMLRRRDWLRTQFLTVGFVNDTFNLHLKILLTEEAMTRALHALPLTMTNMLHPVVEGRPIPLHAKRLVYDLVVKETATLWRGPDVCPACAKMQVRDEHDLAPWCEGNTCSVCHLALCASNMPDLRPLLYKALVDTDEVGDLVARIGAYASDPANHWVCHPQQQQVAMSPPQEYTFDPAGFETEAVRFFGTS